MKHIKIWIPFYILLFTAVFFSAFSNSSRKNSIINTFQKAVFLKKASLSNIKLLTDSPKIICPLTAQNKPNILFKWYKLDTCSKYEIAIARKIDFQNAKKLIFQDTMLFYNCSSMIPGVVFWKVRSLRNDSMKSPWSKLGKFILLGKVKVEKIHYNGCNGNCAHCPNPCGRHHPPVDNF